MQQSVGNTPVRQTLICVSVDQQLPALSGRETETQQGRTAERRQETRGDTGPGQERGRMGHAVLRMSEG